jgi:hypothetical protein
MQISKYSVTSGTSGWWWWGGGGGDGREAVESHIICKLQETLWICCQSSVRPSIHLANQSI